MLWHNARPHRPAGKDIYDAVIVGGGHNGLVCAAYLARAGKRVLVLERRPEPGGAAVSERPFAGHEARLSRYAYLVSLFPRRIADDLGIRLHLATRHVAAYAPPDLLLRTAPGGTWGAFTRLFDTMLEPLPSRDEARAIVGDDAWRDLVERP